MQKLSVKSLAIAFALVWGIGFFLVAAAHAIWPEYGGAFLEMMDSIYPGYRAESGWGQVFVGTLYALVDGAVCGALLALIYNCVSCCPCKKHGNAAP